ncbi:MAG: hypothetical protein KDA80_09980 [Planctomycetaceae bacterium]|nr:hypothetical protein [Planctomycetaceae bacterium]
MRIQPWIKAVTGALLMATSTQTTLAQTPYPQGPAGAPTGYVNIDAGAYGPPGAGYPGPGGPTVVQPQSQPPVPAGYQPWPAISPYHSANIAQTQHYQTDGVWFKELFYRRRDYFASVEVMAILFRDGGGATVGSPYAQNLIQGAESLATGGQFPFGEFQIPAEGEFIESTNVTPNAPGRFVIDPTVSPFPSLSAGATANDTAITNLYPIRDLRDVGGIPTSPGIQVRWGFENEDRTGFMASAWWGFHQELSFSKGQEFINNVRVNQQITSIFQGQNLTTMNGNIPLDNGENIFGPTFGPGSTAKYDILYSMQFTTEAGGTNFSLYQQPIYRTDGVAIRPFWGGRYLYIAEGFQFRGIDSGFNYSVDEDTKRPTPTTVVQAYDQYEANLSNDVRSNIAGPEVGLRLDLGGPHSGFNIWAESIFGLFVNQESIHLRGDNIGDPLTDFRFLSGNPTPRLLDDVNFNSAFNTRRTSTHVSPMFQQSIFADMNVLQFVPILKKSSFFEDARFRFGYTLLLVGEVARPADSIRWQGFPLFPEIQNERKNWWANQFSFAIDWNY